MVRFYVKSSGCQMNAYDAERIADLLQHEGMASVADAAEAELVVLNTCHIREKASEKVYSDIGRLRRSPQPPRIVVAGCTAQAEGAEILRRVPTIDAVVGPQSYHRLPAMLREGTRIETDMPAETKFAHLVSRRRQARSAFLTVQEGCDKFCSFCVVPYTRGVELSRPIHEILDEARGLIDAGACELTLLGQNVNAYSARIPAGASTSFAELIRAVGALPRLARLRYTTSHPRDMTDDLIAAHRDVPTLMPYLHLPVQAGADSLLRRMNRSHSVDSYRRTVDRLRAARPDIALSSDFIVGFPGETDAEFEATLALVAEIGFAQAYSFKYSPRPGTPAATMSDQISEQQKQERLARLQAALAASALAFNAATVGRVCEVLLEKPGRRGGQLIGKSPWLQSVVVEDPELASGDLVEIEITHSYANSLAGRRPLRRAA